MTAPAEDPRGGEVCRCGHGWDVHEQESLMGGSCYPTDSNNCPCFSFRPAAGRGDTDSGGERKHGKVPGSETSENGYLGACWCQGRGDAWPCPAAARPAGDRAQPTQELLEAVARWCAWAYGGEEYAEQTGSNEHWRQVASDLLALPALAALLDAQAAVNRVEALEQTWRRRAVFHAEHGARETAVGLTHRANDLRRALDGTT